MALMMFYRSPAISGDDAHGHDKFQDLFLKSNLVAVLRLKGEDKTVLRTKATFLRFMYPF